MNHAILIVTVYGVSLFFIERVFRRFNILTEQTLLGSVRKPKKYDFL